MCKVNFVDEFNLFMRYARNNQLSGRERLLWTALFSIANDRAIYNAQTREYQWPGDFFPVPNGELSLHCTLDKRGIESMRNSLKQRGLIDFVPGCKSKPAKYKINYLSLNVGYKFVPNDVPNNVPYSVPNDVPNSTPISDPIQPHNNININTIQDKEKLFNYSVDDDMGAGAENSDVQNYMEQRGLVLNKYLGINDETRASVKETTNLLFQGFANRQPTMIDEAYVFQEVYEYDDQSGTSYKNSGKIDRLCYAFEMAVTKGCPGNWQYIFGCLRRLNERGLFNIGDIESFDMEAG